MTSEPETSRCPHTDPLIVEGESFTAQEVVDTIGPLLRPERRARIDETVANRTYSVLPVLEGLYDRGNIGAVLRSAEALGYQAAHIVELSDAYKEAKRVTQGADKWLDIRRWQSTKECIDHLRGLGYRIVATRMEEATPIDQVDFTEATALVFGNEKDGVTEELLSMADRAVAVPMLGFTRSYNISVAAALCFYHIYRERQRLLGAHGDLSPSEKLRLTASYYLRSLESAADILRSTRRPSRPQPPE